MKVIFEKTSQIDILPNITFSKIGKILFVSFGFLNYQMILQFGSYD
jgi:hypothetical protein